MTYYNDDNCIAGWVYKIDADDVGYDYLDESDKCVKCKTGDIEVWRHWISHKWSPSAHTDVSFVKNGCMPCPEKSHPLPSL